MTRPVLAAIPNAPREAESCQRCASALRCWPDDAEARAGVRIARRLTLRRGESVWRQAEPFGAIYLVAHGSLRLAVLHPDGHEQVTGFGFAGEIVGLDGFALGRHACTATALEATELCRVLWHANGASESQAGLEKALLRRLARVRARQATQPAAGDAVAAVVSFVQMLRQRLADRWHDGTLSLPMSRSDIASHLGIAPETLSRAFRTLQQEGRLEANGRELRWRMAPGEASGPVGGAPPGDPGLPEAPDVAREPAAWPPRARG